MEILKAVGWQIGGRYGLPMLGRRCIAALITGLLLVSSAQAQVAAGEAEVKAAFVQNFARFVEWPAGALQAPNAPLVVVVIGDDPIRGALEEMVRGKSAGGHPIEIRHAQWNADLSGSHIVFISASDEHHLPAVLRECEKGSMLTVSDIDRFSLSGGMIELRMVGNHLRFDIDWTAAQAAHINVSSKLLNVARAVRVGRQAGGR